MKYSIKEFAKEIRKLYPEDYNDLTDEKLVELWLKKYPNDREKVDFSKIVKVQSSQPSNTTSGSSWGFLRTVIWIGLIGGGIYLFYNSNNRNYTSSDSTINGGANQNSNNQNTEVLVDPNIADTNNINSEPPVQDAAGILNSQSNEISNQTNNTNEISAQDVENIISKGLDIVSYLSKSNEWESRKFPFRCTKCGESCTATGYYKERTDEFIPDKDVFPTRWFHTHSWERLK